MKKNCNPSKLAGQDGFICMLGSLIFAGPSIEDGEKEIKKFIQAVVKWNKKNPSDHTTVKVVCPDNYKIPPEWWGTKETM